MKRRTFLKNTAIGMTAFAGGRVTGLTAEGLQANGASSSDISTPGSSGEKIGRPVRITSIGFGIGQPLPLKQVIAHVDEEGSHGTDIIMLPETCRGQQKGTDEPLHGPTVTAMAQLAKKHKTYIAVPIDQYDGTTRLNSIVFLDRSGQIVCTYDKIFPYWSEFDLHPVVSPGKKSVVFHTDFGRVGFATCFDANFPEVWSSLADKGAELIVWPSAYSAGRSLQCHAINHHYYIVSCTQVPDCIVYDITGEQLHHKQSKDVNISRVTVDLDRGVYHQNFNMQKRDKLLKEHPDDVAQEQWMELEQWFVLKAKRPGVSARDLARQYGLEELRTYIDRSRTSIDHLRGWEFAEEEKASDKRLG